MNIESILTPERTFANLEIPSKKRLLEKASGVLASAEPGISEQHLYRKLIAREKIGPTAIGNGIAIPHCRVPDCHEITGCLITLDTFIDYDSTDGKPVDLERAREEARVVIAAHTVLPGQLWLGDPLN